MGDKGSIRKCRASSNNLRTADVDAAVCLFLDVDAHLGSLMDTAITINRWVNNRVIEI